MAKKPDGEKPHATVAFPTTPAERTKLRNKAEFGDKICAFRKARGFSQPQLADMIGMLDEQAEAVLVHHARVGLGQPVLVEGEFDGVLDVGRHGMQHIGVVDEQAAQAQLVGSEGVHSSRVALLG